MNRGSPGCEAGNQQHAKTSNRSGRAHRRAAIALLAVVLAATVAPTQAYYVDDPVNREGGHSCTSEQFPCNDDSCISVDWVCDGNGDCPDSEDEFCDDGSSSSSSSSSTPGPGVRSAFQSRSCEIPKTDSYGTVQSPNFNDHIYEEDFGCDFVFIADPNMRIELTFTYFDLECSTCACCDFVDLIQRDVSNTETRERFCCSDSPGVFTSDENFLTLSFVTRTSERRDLPTGALVSSAVEDYAVGVLGALGRAAAAGKKHGYQVTYKHVPANN